MQNINLYRLMSELYARPEVEDADPGYSGLTELGERAMKGYENHVKNGD